MLAMLELQTTTPQDYIHMLDIASITDCKANIALYQKLTSLKTKNPSQKTVKGTLDINPFGRELIK